MIMDKRKLAYIKEILLPPYNKKKFNKLLIIFQHTFLKNSYVLGYPYKIQIDPCNICNLKCEACPSNNSPDYPKGQMSFENYKKIIDELEDYLYFVGLFNWGEPFLNKDIFKMIGYTSSKDIKTTVSSNFNQFTEEIADKVINSKLDTLIISLDGASQKTAHTYQKGTNFDKVVKNIKMMVRKKKEANSKLPYLQWRFIVMKHNEHEIPKAKQLAKEFGIDDIEFAHLRWDCGREVFNDNLTQFNKVKPYLPKNEEYSLYNYKEKRKKIIFKNNCSWIWRSLVINWNGSVSTCELYYDYKYDFGNVFDKGVKAVWNNDNFRSARKSVARNKGFKPTVCDICKKNKAMV